MQAEDLEEVERAEEVVLVVCERLPDGFADGFEPSTVDHSVDPGFSQGVWVCSNSGKRKWR